MRQDRNVQVPAIARAVASEAPRITVPPRWERVTLPRDEALCERLIKECAARDREMLKRLQRLSGEGRSARKRSVRAYCNSDSAKIAAVAREMRGNRGASLSAAELIQTATKLRFGGGCVGRVVLVPNHKDEKPRPVFVFSSPLERAKQRIAHNALKAAAPLPQWAFAFTGGEPAATAWLKERLPRAKKAILTDFPRCFALLPWHMVENGSLLSKRATTALMFEPWQRANMRWPGPGRPTSLGAAFLGDALSASNCGPEIGAGRGIPPGAVFASIVAQIVLLDMLVDLPSEFAGIEMGLFADNLIILLPDHRLETPIRERLSVLATTHFDSIVAREFQDRTFCYEPNQAFRYLGQLVCWKRRRVRFDPLPGHCDRLIERIGEDVALDEPDFSRAIRRTMSFASRHPSSPAATLTIMRAAHVMAEMAQERPGDHNALAALLDPATGQR